MTVNDAHIGFLFPGQGSQYPGMGKGLRDQFKVARETFEQASDALSLDIERLCFEGSGKELELTENTQPAILTVSIATLRVLKKETGLTPLVMAGHSLGEYSALVASGSLGFEDALRVVRKRGEFMQEAVAPGDGAMAAIIGLDSRTVEEICRECASGEIVSPANFNGPKQTVISGHRAAVERAVEMARQKGARKSVMLQVSAPFHCSLMEPAAARLAEVLKEIPFARLQTPVISNVEARPYPSEEEAARLLTTQVSNPVRWKESMEVMIEKAVSIMVEIGPGRVLSGLMKRIEPSIKTFNIQDSASLNVLQESLECAR